MGKHFLFHAGCHFFHTILSVMNRYEISSEYSLSQINLLHKRNHKLSPSFNVTFDAMCLL